MKVKIDTKEKFHIITIEEPVLSANMTGDLEHTLLSFLAGAPRNLVINLEKVQKIDDTAAEQ